MTATEFSDQFDVLFSNITSNQAPGLTEYEKSVFLTKAQNEIVKNYFTANSKGNNIGQGFDDSAKRQADFSCLMKTVTETTGSGSQIDPRSSLFKFPEDVYIVINERIGTGSNSIGIYQVIPLRYDEYTRLMSKPLKRPLKNQAWRLINLGQSGTTNVEIIAGPGITPSSYTVRYIRKPKPIIVGDLDGLSIDEYTYGTSGNKTTSGCELDPIIHEDILQRAVELAKAAWTATGQDNTNVMLQTGQRSE
jgi:hypothetical protein